MGVQRLKGDGVGLEGKTSHLGSHIAAGVHEVEIDGLVGRGAELAGLKVKDVAVLGVDEEVLVADHASDLEGHGEELEIGGLVDPLKQLKLSYLYREWKLAWVRLWKGWGFLTCRRHDGIDCWLSVFGLSVSAETGRRNPVKVVTSLQGKMMRSRWFLRVEMAKIDLKVEAGSWIWLSVVWWRDGERN